MKDIRHVSEGVVSIHHNDGTIFVRGYADCSAGGTAAHGLRSSAGSVTLRVKGGTF